MFFDQSAVEPVVPGGNRSVRRKGHFARDAGHRVMEIDAFFLHPVADSLEDRESAVSFVEVQDARSNPHRLQRAKSSYSEQQLLADTNPAVAAVEARSQ